MKKTLNNDVDEWEIMIDSIPIINLFMSYF